MTVVMQCPISTCDWVLEHDYQLDARNAAAAPGVAAAMGVPLDAFVSIRAQQEARHVEASLEAHFRTHKPVEWVTDLMAARQRLDAVVATVQRGLPKCQRCYYGDSHNPSGGAHDAGSFEAALAEVLG